MSKCEIKTGCVASSFDEFLEDEGILEEATELAVKRVLACRLAEENEGKEDHQGGAGATYANQPQPSGPPSGY